MANGTTVYRTLLGAVLVAALILAFGVAGCGQKAAEQPKADEVKKAEPAKVDKKAKAAKAGGEERFKVPVGKSYFKGEKNAPITIIEFSEFQCPFCSRVNPTIAQLFKDYPNQIKVVFKHNPLPFHKDAFLASEAALAAGAQGKFWEMHDKCFANQKAVKREHLEKYAEEIGLDMKKFKADLDSHKYKADVEADQKEAKQFAARGTPHLFINGIRLRGAQPLDKFKAVIDKELPKALELQKKGEADIYAAIIKDAKTKADPPKPRERKEDKNIYKVKTGDHKASAKGAVKDALITVIEFSDYQCPFSGRAQGTVDKIMEEYKGKVRAYYRHNPLPFHKDAGPAAKAALAAGEQGKFWEMHKVLFANKKALKQADLEKYAKEIGLNVAKFKKDMADPKMDALVKADQAEAQKFGARGTPAFFINGRKITGAQPFANFKKLIDELLPIAQKTGKKGDALYAELTKAGLEKAAAPAKKERPKEDPNKVYKVPAGNSYFKGGKKAPVEIIEISEFQCPFCKRVIPTLYKLLDEYGDKIKIVFKHNPLPFHKDAQLASEATLAAGEQGKFWEMHDKLFENNRALKRPDLEKYAGELGLDMNKFKKALDSGAYKSVVEEDKKLAASVGARGTPTFFINGRKFVGAQPFENFKKMIDEELAKKK